MALTKAKASNILLTTPAASSNDTTPATTEYVTTAVANLIDSAPANLNTLNELAAAMADNASFFSTVLPISGGTMTGNLLLGDSVKAIFGAGSDLQIFHSGTYSLIQENGTGNLIIAAGDLQITNSATTENMLRAYQNGSVELYHDNSVKLATTSAGINVTGNTQTDTLLIDAGGNIEFDFNGQSSAFTTGTSPRIFAGQGSTGSYLAGTLNLQTRPTGASRDINFITGTSPAIRMVIGGTGNVGIGTNAPHSKLHLAETAGGAAGVDFPLTLSSDRYQADYGVGIAFRPENQSTGYKVKTAIIASGGGYGYNQADLHFCLDSDNTVTNEVSLSDTRMIIKKSGSVGIGNTDPAYPLDVTSNSSALGIRIRGRSDHIGELNFASNNGATVYSQIQSLSSELRVKAISNIPMTFFTNNTKRMTLTENGDLGITGTAAVSVTQKATATVTDTQSTGGSYNWTFSTNTGTNNDIGSLDVAGIRNRHVFRWAMSGSMTANTWYPFAKRSEIAAAGPDGGSNANDGFAMYFRVYLYPTLSGWGEYLSSRVSNMCWIANYGSNSTQEQEFVMGPALGHAPNAGQNVDTATSNPVRLRIHHRMGNESNIGANQTFELLLTQSLTGLNPAVNGRLVYIYGYVL